MTTVLLLMYHCKMTNFLMQLFPLNSSAPFLYRAFFFPRYLLCTANFVSQIFHLSVWERQAGQIKGLLPFGFGSTCRTGFLLAGRKPPATIPHHYNCAHVVLSWVMCGCWLPKYISWGADTRTLQIACISSPEHEVSEQ